MAKTTILFIHGIGDQQQDWLNLAEAAVLLGIAGHQDYRLKAFTWSQYLDKAAVNKLYQAGAFTAKTALMSQPYGSLLGMAVQWLGNKAGDVQAYDSALAAGAMVGLMEAIEEAEGEVILYAHSLGSVLAFDTLVRLKAEYPKLYAKVSRVIMAGSPLDRWTFKKARKSHFKALSDKKVFWLFGTRDFVTSTTPAWTGQNDCYRFHPIPVTKYLRDSNSPRVWEWVRGEKGFSLKVPGIGHDLNQYLMHTPRFCLG